MSMLFKRIKDWATNITAFRTGDVIPVDGPQGTAKMSKDSLLQVTAQNALDSIKSIEINATVADLKAGNYFALDSVDGSMKLSAELVVSKTGARKGFYFPFDIGGKTYWHAGGIDSSTGEPIARANRFYSDFLEPDFQAILHFSKSDISFSSAAYYIYDKDKNYLGYHSTSNDYFNLPYALTLYPTAKFVRLSLVDVSPSGLSVDDVFGSKITAAEDTINCWSDGIEKVQKEIDSLSASQTELSSNVSGISSRVAEVRDLVLDGTSTIALGNPSLWMVGSVNTSDGSIGPATNAMVTNAIPFASLTSYTRGTDVSFNYKVHAYTKGMEYLGSGTGATVTDISAFKEAFPTFYYGRIALTGLAGADVSPSNINNIITFASTVSIYTAGIDTRLFNVEQEVAKGVDAVDKVLHGKKWCCIGDSFSYGGYNSSTAKPEEPPTYYNYQNGIFAGKQKTYPRMIALRHAMNLVDLTMGGRTIGLPADGTSINSATYDANLSAIPADADFVTIYLGINDSHAEHGSVEPGEEPPGYIPFGQFGDTTRDTFHGAWHYILDYITNKCPFAKLGIIVSNGCDADKYRTAEIEIASKWGISYIDLNGDERTPAMIRSTNPNVLAAVKTRKIEQQAVNPGTNNHPNVKAHEFESTFIEAFLKSL